MSAWIWEPSTAQIESTNLWRFLQRLGFRELAPFLDWSVANLETFWDECVRECGIHWFRPYTQVLDESRGPQWSRWFTDGTTNLAANCLDRHDGLAIVWESEDGSTREISFEELRDETNRIASYLLSLGLQQGDRVAIVLPMVPGVVAILYACFKLGLVVVPIFSGFGEQAIWTRLADSGARLVVTVESLMRRGKPVAIHSKVAEALQRGTKVQNVVLYEWGSLGTSREVETAELPSETTALILYTSGTTGKPKGVVHTHGGCLAQMAKEIYFAFDHRPTDRFWWLSDIGWMMGPWKIIGNHCLGGTIFLYDGAPDFPDTNRLWGMIDRHRITTFGISPTAIRMLMKDSRPGDFDLSSLRFLGSIGEPWDDTSWIWFFEQVGGGRAPVINISGGTEIVGSFLTCLPVHPLKPCSLGQPSPGIATDIVDEHGQSVRGRMGYLVCKRPCPSMTRGVWNDPERYLNTYWSRFPGWWNHGDWASTDEDGVWYVHGRADESMNVAGRKVGPAEVEEALIEHPAVVEAAVIGVPDETKGEGIVAFVVVKSPVEPAELSAHLVKTMGPTFRPNAVEIVPELPKTQSGKIVRRLIRQRYLGEKLGDASTVANTSALDSIRGSTG
jgi:acetyl-CoA synthetase